MRSLFLLMIVVSAGSMPVSLYAAAVDTVPARIVRFDKFSESSLASCHPRGWLREFLDRQRNGLTGHPEALSYPFNTCLWAGVIQRPDGHGDTWWPYEQTAYYSDGLLRLGYLLGDSDLIRRGRQGINFILEHPQENGRLGLAFNTNHWPMAVYFRALQAEYLATGNPNLLNALHRHYLSFRPEQFGKEGRAIVNIEGVLWTYGKTGDPALLALAETAYLMGGFELNMDSCLTSRKIVLHGVTYMEEAKLPAILYAYTGKKQYLEAAVNAMKKLDRDHMLPDGVPSSSEFLAGKNPVESHETCDISDYTWSLGYLLMATGDVTWADHIEKAIFNAGPGAVSKDFKNFQYFSSVNQFIATGNSNSNKNTAYGSNWMEYRPCHAVECCAGNVNRFMPNYAARMWMRDAEGNPVAALYGPSVEKISPADAGQSFTITEKTNYPFSDEIVFIFNMKAPHCFPFSFRIPGWCRNAGLLINGKAYTGALSSGTFVTLNRTFRDGDKIRLHLPMEVKTVQWDSGGIAVERGPLLFAYAVAENVKRDTVTYDNLNGKKADLPDFPALMLRPAGPWNYALARNEKDFLRQIRVVNTGNSGYPFDPASVPVALLVPARKVTKWVLADNRYTPFLPAQATVSGQPVTIRLVPYGSTRLRVSVFPGYEAAAYSLKNLKMIK